MNTFQSRFEKLDLTFPIEQLREQLINEVMPLPPELRGAHVAAWSLLSANGDYRDGFQKDLPPYNGPMNQNPHWAQASSMKHIKSMQDYSVPTQICTGAFAQVLSEIDGLGFWPRRARIIRLAAQSTMSFHVDCLPGQYAVRLHIPLITNDKCFFEYENEKLYLQADGSSYLVDVSVPHRATNHGGQDRFHLVVCVWDTKAVSQKYPYKTAVDLPKKALGF